MEFRTSTDQRIADARPTPQRRPDEPLAGVTAHAARRDPQPVTGLRGWKPFVRHYVEMVIAMLAGMIVLNPLCSRAFAAAGGPDPMAVPEIGALVMATTMTIGMSVWMRIRGHGWAPIAEMAAAMYLPFLVLFLPLWAGLITAGAVFTWGHVLMLPAMAAVMLRRRAEYSHC
jgi:hypothetical protein